MMYALIVETKEHEPMIYESYASLSYDQIYEGMERFAKDPNVIRVAVAKLEYQAGNKSLFKEGKK